jgi:transposase
MIKLELTQTERHRLKGLLRVSHESHYYRRLLALGWLDAGRTVSEVAALLGVSRQAVYDWILNWNQHRRFEELGAQQKQGRPADWNATMDQLLEASLQKRPRELGYAAQNWSVPLLRRHFFEQTECWFSASTLRHYLHRNGFEWKRPRYSLRADPDAEKKSLDSRENRAFGPSGCHAL